MYTETQLLIFSLLYTYSYLVLFPLVVFEGPVATLIAGLLTSNGFLAFIPAYVTVVFADLAGDFMFYSIGRWWFNRFIHGFFGFLKTDVKQIERFKEVIKIHRGKVLFFGKLSHAIGAPILVASGLAGISIKDFFWFNFLATIPKSLVIMLVGYYFGSTLTNLDGYLRYTLLGLILITAVLILIYLFIVRVANNIMDKLEKPNNSK